MTLIAYLCHEDRAEFITDTLSYTSELNRLGKTTKWITLAHINTAVLAQGDGVMGAEVKWFLLRASSGPGCQSYDALVGELPDWLRELWGDLKADQGDDGDLVPSVVHVLGWSDSAQRFTAHLFASRHDFRAEPVEGLYAYPTHGAHRPSDLEAEQLREDLRPNPGIDQDTLIDNWLARPPRPEPVELGDWMSVALEARSRALSDTAKVLVAGSVFYTELSRDSISTFRLLDFNDKGDELLDLIGFTKHPIAQARPCWCGSGKRFLDCHLQPALDTVCGCGEDALFRDCCMVTDDSARLP